MCNVPYEPRGIMSDVTEKSNVRSRRSCHYRHRRRPLPTTWGKIGVPKKKEDDETRYQRASKELEHFRSFRYSRSLVSISEDDETERDNEENDLLGIYSTTLDGVRSNERDANDSTHVNNGTIRRSKTFACLRNLAQDDGVDVSTATPSNFWSIDACEAGNNGNNIVRSIIQTNHQHHHGSPLHHVYITTRAPMVPQAPQA